MAVLTQVRYRSCQNTEQKNGKKVILTTRILPLNSLCGDHERHEITCRDLVLGHQITTSVQCTEHQPYSKFRESCQSMYSSPSIIATYTTASVATNTAINASITFRLCLTGSQVRPKEKL